MKLEDIIGVLFNSKGMNALSGAAAVFVTCRLEWSWGEMTRLQRVMR